MKHILLSFIAAAVLFVPAIMAQASGDPATEVTVVGAWNVSYTLGPTPVTRQLRFIAYSDHTGKFFTGPRPTATTNFGTNAVWDDPSAFFTFSGEVRLPLGNVGQETGTLAFTAFNGNTGLLECQVIFVQNILSPSAQPHYTVRTGTCVATSIVTPTP